MSRQRVLLMNEPRGFAFMGRIVGRGEKVMKRFGVVAAAIAALLVSLLGAPAVSAAQRSEGTPVVVVNVSPLDRNGSLKPGYQVVARLHGANCWTGSDTIPGTYRCMIGNSILDPCWPRIDAQGRYHGSYCLTVPWRHVGIVLRGRHVPPDHRKGRAMWGVHTTDGYGCVASPGANGMFHGQFEYWRCDHGDRWLLFDIDKGTAQWQATEVTNSGGHIGDAHRVGITKAWYGVSPFGRH